MAKRDLGRWAIVTGASSGIGAALARALGAAGCACVLVARRRAALEEVAASLPPARALVWPADVSTLESSAELATALAERGIEPDLLALNAGFGIYGALAEAEPARLAALVDTNCRSPLLWARTFLPGMLQRGRGGILLVASTGGLVPMPYYASYGASKAFIVSLGRALAAEVSGSGVGVLTLCPGPVHTGFFAVAEAPGPLGSPQAAVQTPEQVAAEALAAWRAGRSQHTCGASNRLAMTAGHLLPPAWIDRVARRVLRPTRKG